MKSFFSFAVVICFATSCRSYVITTVEADLFEKTLEQTSNAQLVDVRTFKEFSEEHLPKAILMDIKEVTFDSLIHQLDKNRPVFVYCRVGRRSLEAAKILEKNKFKMVYNLEGGIIAWKEKGKMVVTEE